MKTQTKVFKNKLSPDDEVCTSKGNSRSPAVLTLKQSKSQDTDQHGGILGNFSNTAILDTSSGIAACVKTPVQDEEINVLEEENVEVPQELEAESTNNRTENVSFWEASSSIHCPSQTPPVCTQTIVDTVADPQGSDFPELFAPSSSIMTMIRARINEAPHTPTQIHVRNISDSSTLPVSLRSTASDSCLDAKYLQHSHRNISVPFSSPVLTKSPQELFKRLVDLKSERAWNSLLESREVAHANEIADLHEEHSDEMKEVRQEAQATITQGLEKADRTRTHLQKQLKKINAAKEDAQSAFKTVQGQLAQQQAEYQEVVAAFQREVLDRKAAEQNCGTLETQLDALQAQYKERETALIQENARLQDEVLARDQLAQEQTQFLARDNALSLENRRLLGVISDMQLKTYELEFKMMKHQACITPEQYTQTQDALKEQLGAAKRQVDSTRAKIYELTYVMEGTPTENMVGQAQLIEARTKQVEDLSTEVLELTTQLADTHNEKMRLEAKSKLSSESRVKEVARAASVKEILEKKVEILRTANEELMAYPRALLRNSQNDLVEAVSIGMEALRNERSSLDANLQKTTAALKAAEEDLALWKFRHHSLSEEMSAKNEKIAELENQNIKLDSETGRLDIELSAITHEKDQVIKEKDRVIDGLEEVTQDFNELVYQEADARTAWLLKNQAAQLKKLNHDFQEERSVVAAIEWQESKRRERDMLDDALGYHQHEMFQQTTADLRDCQDELRQNNHALDESREECQRLKAKVLLLTGMKDREQSGAALRNAFAQSKEQPINHNHGFSVPSPSTELASSVQTVLRHTETMADVDAQYFRGRDSCFVAELRKAVEESDRQLAETLQNEEYRTVGSYNSSLTALPVVPPDAEAYTPPDEEAYTYGGSPVSSVSSEAQLPLPIPRNGPSNARPISTNGSFRQPLGNNDFYNHYDQWLARKGKAKMVEESATPSYDHLADGEFRRLRLEGIKTAGEANREGGLDDGPEYHYDLSKAEAETSEIYTMEEVYSVLWSEEPCGEEKGRSASISSMLVGVDDEEWRMARTKRDAEGLPYAEFSFDDTPAEE